MAKTFLCEAQRVHYTTIERPYYENEYMSRWIGKNPDATYVEYVEKCRQLGIKACPEEEYVKSST